MNKELETIIENEFDCLISELGCLMGDEWKAESIKKVVNQAFSLNAVSQRSELLIAYEVAQLFDIKDKFKIATEKVDRYLSNAYN